MGDENPNAQVEANLLEGKGRYASAGTTLQDILNDLDSTAAGLQSSWLGGASQDFQDKQGQLTTTVQRASDVLQKGSISIGKMYDSYLEADEKQKLYKQVNDVLEKFMGVFMLFTAALGVVGALLELADVAFAAEIGALEAVVEVGEVTTDVTADVGIGEVDTLSSLENVSDIAPIEEIPVPVDTPPTIPPQEAPVDPPLDTPVDPPLDAPADPPLDTPVKAPQNDEAPANVDQPSEEPTPTPAKHDSGIDLSQDQQDLLGKLDEKPLEGKNLDDFLPLQPDEVQVNVVHTDENLPTNVVDEAANEIGGESLNELFPDPFSDEPSASASSGVEVPAVDVPENEVPAVDVPAVEITPGEVSTDDVPMEDVPPDSDTEPSQTTKRPLEGDSSSDEGPSTKKQKETETTMPDETQVDDEPPVD